MTIGTDSVLGPEELGANIIISVSVPKSGEWTPVGLESLLLSALSHL